MTKTQELLTEIYDTLKGNTQYPQFDPNSVNWWEKDTERGTIDFVYQNNEYQLSLKRII